MTEKKMFITGGAGFIGSHLVDRLLGEGNEVTVYDNLASGKLENIKYKMNENGFHFLKADLLDFETLKEAMKGHELIWHLGANTDIPSGIKATDLDLKNCTIATHDVLDAMRQNGIKKLIFTSTSAVYGDAPPIPLAETYGPILPISLYGAGKLACEGQCLDLATLLVSEWDMELSSTLFTSSSGIQRNWRYSAMATRTRTTSWLRTALMECFVPSIILITSVMSLIWAVNLQLR